MFLAQLIGTLNIALPLVLGYQIAPEAVLSRPGIAASAVLVGAYIYYINDRQSKNRQQVLQYKPTGKVKQDLEDEIAKCGMDPEDIALRYSYLNDNIANSDFNMICVDPMVWQGLEGDKEIIAISDVIEQHILPTVPEQNKQMQDHIKKVITPAAQRFIFRHELGHTYRSYSKKALASLFAIAALATGAGMTTTYSLISKYGGFIALLAGLGVSVTVDTLLGYLNNAFFKAQEERKADQFAMQFSTPEEIEAAADFFDAYELGAQKLREQSFLLSYLPIAATTGHPSAQERTQYLRDGAKAHQS